MNPFLLTLITVTASRPTQNNQKDSKGLYRGSYNEESGDYDTIQEGELSDTIQGRELSDRNQEGGQPSPEESHQGRTNNLKLVSEDKIKAESTLNSENQSRRGKNEVKGNEESNILTSIKKFARVSKTTDSKEHTGSELIFIDADNLFQSHKTSKILRFNPKIDFLWETLFENDEDLKNNNRNTRLIFEYKLGDIVGNTILPIINKVLSASNSNCKGTRLPKLNILLRHSSKSKRSVDPFVSEWAHFYINESVDIHSVNKKMRI